MNNESKIILEGILQKSPDYNGRIYPEDVWKKHVENYIKEKKRKLREKKLKRILEWKNKQE
jgi:hypothetical protein